VNRLRQRSRRWLTALLALQLVVGVPVHAQPEPGVAKAAGAAVVTSAHCADHAMDMTSAPAREGMPHHGKGCCDSQGCTTGHCGGHCAGALAASGDRVEGMALGRAEPGRVFLAEPRVDRRAFEFFRPPI